MMDVLKCESCGRTMRVEFRIPRLGAPGRCHDFYSCECGYVTSREHADSETLQAAEREVSRIKLSLDAVFLKWARRQNLITAAAVPPKPPEPHS